MLSLSSLFTAEKMHTPFSVSIIPVGRQHGGKSCLIECLYPAVIQKSFPSGLRFGISDPRRMAAVVEAYKRFIRRMHTGKQPTTTHQHWWQCSLFQGDRELAEIHVGDPVGQVLTRLTDEAETSPLDTASQSFYAAAARADIFWGVIPIPLQPVTLRVRQKLHDDLQLIWTAIRHALKQRQVNYPCALALLLTRLDARYENAQTSRAKLTTEFIPWVRQQLKPQIAETRLVDECAIFPVSALGFGTTSNNGCGNDDDPASYGETEAILRSDAEPNPVGLANAFVWSVAAAYRLRPVNRFPDLAVARRTVRLLTDDLEALPSWHIPLKS